MIRRFSLYFGVMILLLKACASAPVQEMSDARQAIQAAKAAGADASLDQHLSQAESHLQQAQEALEKGEYKSARTSALAAREEALHAQQNQSNNTN